MRMAEPTSPPELTEFLLKYESVLKNPQNPINSVGSSPQREIWQLQFAAQMSEDLAKVAQSETKDEKTLENIVTDAVNAITTQTRQALGPFLSAAYIDDTLYAKLIAEQEEGRPIEIIAAEASRIENALYSLKAKGKEKGKGKLSKHTTTRITEFSKQLTNNISVSVTDRKNFVREAITSVISGVYDTYMQRRNNYVKRIESFEGNTQRIEEFSDMSDDEAIDFLTEWNVSAQYTELHKALEYEKGLPDNERKSYQQRLENARTHLESTIPAMSTSLLFTIEKKMGEYHETMSTLFSPKEGTFSPRETNILQLLKTTKNLVEQLGSKELAEVLHNNAPQIPGSLDTLINNVSDQIQFYRVNKETFQHFIDIVHNHTTPLATAKEFTGFAEEYQQIYGKESWKTRHLSQKSVFYTAEQLRKAVNDRIKTLFKESADEQLGFVASWVGTEVPLSKARIDKVNELKQIVATVKEGKAKNSLYAMIAEFPQFKELDDALQEPTAALTKREKIRSIGRTNFFGRESSDLYETYKKSISAINEQLQDMSHESAFYDALNDFAQQTRHALTSRFAKKMQALEQHVKQRPIRKLSDRELDEQRKILTEIVALQNEAFPDDPLTKRFEETTHEYEMEAVRRQQPLYRATAWLKRKLFSGPEKYYVLDTNVLMSDSQSVHNFGSENAVVILSEVQKELDYHKEFGKGDAKFFARDAGRTFDRITAGADADFVERQEEDDVEEDNPTTGAELEPSQKTSAKKNEKRTQKSDMRLPRELSIGMISYNTDKKGEGTTIITYYQDAPLFEKAMKGNRVNNKFMDALMRRTSVRTQTNADEFIIMGAKRFEDDIKKQRGTFQAAPPVIFVSKDANARNMARTHGLKTQNYRREQLPVNPERMYTGYRYVRLSPTLMRDVIENPLTDRMLESILEEASSHKNVLKPRRKVDTPFVENEFVIARNPDNEQQTLILRYRNGLLQPLKFLPEDAQKFPLLYTEQHPESRFLYNANPRGARQFAAVDLLLDPETPIVTLAGGAGTGKSYLAIAAGLQLLLNMKNKVPYNKMYLTKPNIESGPALGTLPGGIDDKEGPMTSSLLQHIYTLITNDQGIPPNDDQMMNAIREKIHTDVFQIAPLAIMRGRNIPNGYRILDEAQNTTIEWMKMFVTRHADPAKTVLCGDATQVDRPNMENSNGLADVRLSFIGEPQYGHITFEKPERGVVAEMGHKLLGRRR